MASKDYWIVNISKLNVSLGDLGLTIPAMKTVNLGDNKHYKLTDEQIQKSINNGSIKLKSKYLILRSCGPEINKKTKPCNFEPTSFKKKIIGEIVKEKKFDELLISDEDFANEMVKDENDTNENKENLNE